MPVVCRQAAPVRGEQRRGAGSCFEPRLCLFFPTLAAGLLSTSRTRGAGSMGSDRGTGAPAPTCVLVARRGSAAPAVRACLRPAPLPEFVPVECRLYSALVRPPLLKHQVAPSDCCGFSVCSPAASFRARPAGGRRPAHLTEAQAGPCQGVGQVYRVLAGRQTLWGHNWCPPWPLASTSRGTLCASRGSHRTWLLWVLVALVTMRRQGRGGGGRIGVGVSGDGLGPPAE